MAITKARSFRFDQEILDKLCTLSLVYDMSESDVVRRLINQEYLRVMSIGKDKVKKYNDVLTYILANLSDILSNEN